MKRALTVCLLCLSVLSFLGTQALAVLPDEILSDPALEARARSISAELRCLVCQNQSIDDSDASLARDLRVLVRERLVVGDSDAQVIEFVVARYGEFVLLRPSFSMQNALLWSAPIAILVIGGFVLLVSTRNRRKTRPPDLTESEQADLDKILQGGDRET